MLIMLESDHLSGQIFFMQLTNFNKKNFPKLKILLDLHKDGEFSEIKY